MAPSPIYRPRTNYTCHQKPNPSRETVPSMEHFKIPCVKCILSGSTRKIREIWKMGMDFEGTLRT